MLVTVFLLYQDTVFKALSDAPTHMLIKTKISYQNTGFLQPLLESKVAMFKRNPDIEDEFENWIVNKSFRTGGVVKQGYNASELAELSEYLNGADAFCLLIKLRESPEKGLKRIKGG